MSRKRTWWTGMLVLPLVSFSAVQADEPPSVRVMSFNIRLNTPSDGPNQWPRRKEMLLETIERFAPDLLGTQEVLAEQADFLAEKLSEHTMVGVGRDDAKRRGEFASVFFRTKRFERLDAGHFWLSKTPDVPGSKSWDSAITRMATWVRLADRQHPKPELLFVNTHWDHAGVQARLESAGLIRRWLVEHARGAAVIFTGDLNTPDDSPPYRTLLPAGEDPLGLADAHRQVHPQRQRDEATYHAFTGAPAGSRIDFILASKHFTAVEAAIDRTSRDGRYPSDHFPVTAVLRWK
jgi:endonuclease/exonuclease/phosphatase family metal-dependent hydrolase